MTTTRIMLASVGLLLSACGGTTTPAADQTVTLNVVISHNPETKLAVAPLSLQALFVHHKTFGQNYFHGRLSGTHQVEISKNGREWIAVGPVEVPDGTYAYLRLTSRASRAELEAGRIPATDIETAISITPHQLLPALIVPALERRT